MTKTLSLFLALALFALPALSAPPAVTMRKALDLAEQALASKGVQKEVYIKSIALQRTTIMNAKAIWVVTWSESIAASKPGRKEIGLEIDMTGDVVHLVKE